MRIAFLFSFKKVLNHGNVIFSRTIAEMTESKITQHASAIDREEMTLNQSVTEAKFFKYDYYYRLHMTPRELNLGNISGEQTREVYFWNAYFEPRHLRYDSDSLHIAGDYAPLEERKGIVRVDGQNDVDESIDLDFSGEAYVYRIYATVRLVWAFMPFKDYSEHFEWLTDVLTTRRNEQRFSLRRLPRRGFDYSFVLDIEQHARAALLLDTWQHKDWTLPIWRERQTVAQASGATLMGYPVGEWLLYQDWRQHEMIEIVDDKGKLKAPLSAEYRDALLMPVASARLQSDSLERLNAHYTRLNTSFLLNEPAAHESQTMPETLDGIEIFSRCLLIGVQESYAHDVDIIDNQTGKIVSLDTFIRTRWRGELRLFAANKDEQTALLAWFYHLSGRLREFWLPSGAADMRLKNTISPSSSSMEIESIGAASLAHEHYALAFFSKDGRRFYTRIIRIIAQGTHEQVIFSPNLNADLSPDDIERISLMRRCRLDSDRLSIQYRDKEMANINIGVISL